MRFQPLSALAIPVVVAAAAAVSSRSDAQLVPALKVPECPGQGVATFNESNPDHAPFPLTKVSLCYTLTFLELKFEAYNEESFFFNPDHKINDDIWQYEVMGIFISPGPNDPATYLEVDVSPNNVTYQAFIFNPTRVHAAGTPFDRFLVGDPKTDGIEASTHLDREAQIWTSLVQIPLTLFNVEDPQGSLWRINFFRTVTSPELFPDRRLGAWALTDQPHLHVTPCFGKVTFI
uniref:Carbohydrate-binding domain-containing protein n=1 Tax=Talaromyces marneffei PM1 TaxID=1077442 RepID=A0A093VJ14_TALMA